MGTPRIDGLDKNYIINGAKDFWQRNVGPVNISTSQLYQSSDRFVNYYSGTVTGTPQIQRSTNVPANSFARYSSQISSQRNASQNEHIRYQRIESIFAKELSNKKVSLGLDVYADVGTSVKIILVSYASPDAGGLGTGFYEETKTITVGQWQRVKFENISVGNLANGLGVYTVVTAPSGTDGSAQSSYVTNIKLNIGTKAQEMSYAGRDYVEEIQLCQRYYYQVDGILESSGRGFSQPARDYAHGVDVWFPVQMRVAPVFTNNNLISEGGVAVRQSTDVNRFYYKRYNTGGTDVDVGVFIDTPKFDAEL